MNCANPKVIRTSRVSAAGVRERQSDYVKSLLARASAAGCTTLVLTVDLPVAGMRHRDHGAGQHHANGETADE